MVKVKIVVSAPQAVFEYAMSAISCVPATDEVTSMTSSPVDHSSG